MTSYTVKVQESADGDLYIQLPDDLLEHTGWTIGDTLLWTENEDNTITLEKANDSSNEPL